MSRKRIASQDEKNAVDFVEKMIEQLFASNLPAESKNILNDELVYLIHKTIPKQFKLAAEEVAKKAKTIPNPNLNKFI